MRIITRSRAEAQEILAGNSDVGALISIHSPANGAIVAFRPEDEFPCKGFAEFSGPKLELVFDDLDDPDSCWLKGRYFAPQASDIQKALEWAAQLTLPEDRCLLVHCSAGVARSAAVTYSIHAQRLGPGGEQEALEKTIADRPQAWTNDLIVKHADALLGRDGALLATVAAWKQDQKGKLVLV